MDAPLSDNLRAKKSLGQHFLTNTFIAHDIAAAAEILPGEIVLEIGPGTGVLTRELLEMRANVIAVEADDRAIPILKETFAQDIERGALTLIHADVREYELRDSGVEAGKYKVVANIPYYLSGMLFERILSSTIQPNTLVFLVQKEVAVRIARSKKESLLSLSVKAYGHPIYMQTVSRGNFRPVPGVDSAILRIEHISKRRFSSVSEVFFFTVLKAGFKAKRKQLIGNLSDMAPREELLALFAKLDLPPDIRGEDIHIDKWFLLAEHLHDILSPK